MVTCAIAGMAILKNKIIKPNNTVFLIFNSPFSIRFYLISLVNFVNYWKLLQFSCQ